MSVKSLPKCSVVISPLDRSGKDIRILSLKPGKPTDPIICTLSKASLDHKPRYEALSYVWGDPSICKKIILDNQEKNVTINLFAALRRLRQPEVERQLWVDALCINQEDDDERTHQVGLMSYIYGQAREVLLWLGDYDIETQSICTGDLESDNGTKAREYPVYHRITANHRDIVVGFLFIRLLADHAPGKITCVQTLTRGFRLDELETGLRTIMNFPWWTRLWTVQEVVLANLATVVCGGLRLEWDTITSAALNLGMCPRYCQENCPCPGLDLVLVFRFLNKVNSILDLQLDTTSAEMFTIHRDRFASDPRDYVYALLGVLPAGEADFRVVVNSKVGKIAFGPRRCLDPTAIIRPNYSLDHRVVYADAVVGIIRETRCLDILWRPREFNRDPLLPTWVPDWTAAIDTSTATLGLSLYKSLMVGKCTGHPDPVVDYVSESGILTLLGVEVDTVACTYGTLQEQDLSAAVVDPTFSSWRSGIVEPRPYPRGEGTYEEAFWILLAKDRIMKRDPAIEFGRDTVMAIKGRTCYAVGPSDNPRIKAGEWKLIKERHEASPLGKSWLLQRSLNQSFFITKSGLVGLGPFDIQVGDRVYILAGAKCPFLLRRAGDGGPFTLVGAAFVQGMMFNEADPADWSVAQPVTLI